MPLRGVRSLLLAVLATLAMGVGAVHALGDRHAAHVLIITSERGGAYDETIDVLRQRLMQLDPPPVVEDRHWEEAVLDTPARVLVTVGTRAATEIGAGPRDTVVFNTLLPSHSFAHLHQRRSADELDRISAVFLDQPAHRQIALIREALPEWTNLALISGPATRELSMSIETEARRSGLSVHRSDIDSEKELFHALRETLARPALLLAVPDRELYNSTTIQNILLTSYRRNSPLIGFSGAYVRAGALLAVYSSPAHIAAQTAEAVIAVLEGKPLPAPSYPAHFEVGINPTVARSLRIRLDSASAIEERLRLLEEQGATRD